MNIGFLISDFNDEEVKRICIGANKAADEKGVTLVYLMGKYISPDAAEAKNFEYQYSAVYDYARSSDFDILIIDAERISSKTTILKKESFLKQFEGTLLLTLSKEEGYPCINEVPEGEFHFEQQGYEAICDAIFYAKNQTLPPIEPEQEFEDLNNILQRSVGDLSYMSFNLFNRKFDNDEAYTTISEIAKGKNDDTIGILLYDKKIRNTPKYPWKRPEDICIKNALIEGASLNYSNNEVHVATDRIISTFCRGNAKTYVIGPIFAGEYQMGILVDGFFNNKLIDGFYDTLLGIITGAVRVINLEKEIEKVTEELYGVQEELARDDSVLDHIGDQDYLTGGLNRRGFFAKAYDLLKEEFTEGKYAVVAYIHMESLKQINEMYGHDEGDRAVKRVADILQEVFGESVYGRIRGNEFAVIEISDDDGKAEALRQEMSAQNAKLLKEPGRYINHLQYSICEFSHDENLSLREMLKETDENLMRIKGNI